ncbi:MAG: hypothetical protein M0008_00365, partial [Actinomycetota bacterium]|nr:hypothetical protein [Actinomycetota bacterium]
GRGLADLGLYKDVSGDHDCNLPLLSLSSPLLSLSGPTAERCSRPARSRLCNRSAVSPIVLVAQEVARPVGALRSRYVLP